MAFCNSCGASLPNGAGFCEKCGAAVTPGSTPAISSTTPAGVTQPPPPVQGSALKTILIIGVVLVALVVVGIATSVIVGIKIARRSHVKQEGDKVSVYTPFGTVETNADAEAAAKNLGMEIYPGARIVKNSSASAVIGGMTTVAARFESDDSVSKVADFYKHRFPNANVTAGGGDHFTIVQSDSNGAITINITPLGNGSQFNIANIHKGGSSSQ